MARWPAAGLCPGERKEKTKRPELTQRTRRARARRVQKAQRKTKTRRTRSLCVRTGRLRTLEKILPTSFGNLGCLARIFITRNGRTRRRARKFGQQPAAKLIPRLRRSERRRKKSTT